VLLFPTRLRGVRRTPQLGVQLGRSVLLLASTVFNFLALFYLSLGQVASITFTSPIMVAALAVLLLKERVETLRWLAIGLGFAGTLMVVQPFGAHVNVGTLLAVGCAATYALYQVSTRIVREAEPIVSLFFGGLVGMVALTLIVPFFWEWPTLRQWLLFAAMGAGGAAGHLFVIMALQRGEASRIAPFTYIQLLWAMLASLVLFGDVPGLWTVIGAAVIVTSGLVLFRLDRAERSRLRSSTTS
jgi:drug/metabolite transporter (DMT)-like permease